ncbi:MAG: beta-lactamase family protein [Vicinamibacterales bacterium]|nr:beta-lactamase family protein [Vicinamibacterales bacterium]
MRRLVLVLTLGLLCLRPGASAQGLVFELFQEYLEPLRVQVGIPGLAAAIVGPDGILWEHAYGQQDIAATIAVRPDTPFPVEGLTEVVTASIVLRCVEDRRLSLDDRIGEFAPTSPDADATIGQLLTHTSGSAENPVFSYRPQRLDPLKAAIRACTEDSFRETLSNTLNQFAMVDSVPGPDVVELEPPDEGIPTQSDRERYVGVLKRQATGYAIDARGRASAVQWGTRTLTPSGGLVSTVRDLAKFDVALRQGLIVRPDTLSAAWRGPMGRGGQRLPHGFGWFVETFGGEPVVWQFGLDQGAGSSLMVTLPTKGITMILLANSDRLVRPLPLADGDVTVSPFARLFLNLFSKVGAQ